MTAALVAAVAASLSYGVASVLQAAGAAGTAATSRVLVRPAYLAGLVADLLGWALSLVAVRRLPLFAVQAVLAASLAVTVLLAVRFLGSRLRGRDAVAVAAVVLGSAVLAAAAGTQPDVRAGTGLVAGVVLAVVATAAAVAASWTRGPAVVPALLAGTAYGLAALAARAVHLVRPAGGWVTAAGAGHLLSQPLVWVVVAGNVLGTVVYARALQRGAVGPVAGGLWVAEVVVPGALGLGLLGDTVRPGWAVPAVLAAAAVLAAVLVLAGAPGTAAAAEVPADSRSAD